MPVHVSPLPLHDIRQALGAEPQHYVPLVRRRHLHLEPLQASVSGRLNNLPHHRQTQSATSLDVHGTSHKPIITYAAIECARHGQDSSKLGTSRPKQPRMLPAIKRVRYIGWCLLGGFQKARGRAHLERTRDVGSGRDIGHDEQLLGHGPVVLANVCAAIARLQCASHSGTCCTSCLSPASLPGPSQIPGADHKTQSLRRRAAATVASG